MEAAAYCVIMNPECTPPYFVKKCRKPVGQRGIHHALQPTLRHIGVLAESNPQKVHCKRNGLAVEIAARDYLIFPGKISGLSVTALISRLKISHT